MKCVHLVQGAPLVIAFSLLTIATTAAIAKPFTYVNARFGTSCTFPDEIFSDRLPEPENGDGQQWSAPDGASLTCWGNYNIDSDTPKGFVADEKANTGPGYKITYSKTGKNWAVVSGIKGDKVFNERRLFGKDGVIRTVWIEYPSSRKAKYDPLTGAIAASLRGP
ncbi:MAG: hypothetical protein E5X23_10330 [Mesorhizobium sp.]|uniref:hypothetical protein n=1 Tax=unclassified Mesorhizobium TaxID=325217 RepID=UPI000F75815F|nr:MULTISPECIES: hypothetical protein [unclassified Mesorhizobium]TGV87115.1 hypothetical protein EN801_026350 [Mesorhizobium sp. M00.F.Ca.ET.158.01.1.1]AZO62945.1 hypothetical protein EJ078_29745 [Mesorhizobium sp. M1A.F.Ca.IN.022.06.1.1]MCT2578631.1 hypothetical protein [Mesorhizobium sp. P13.3]MDF3167354.1 hypothetical protein [Mesorhizobium sp. P16.1]MDF3179116.1 hypothetical protein [Mesorhizobium sp. P17.1]